MNPVENYRRAARALIGALGGVAVVAASLALSGCSEVANNPHPFGSEKTNSLFVPLLSRSPKYLDPTSSYSNDETPFTYQVYEPLYGYHYLKRPYELIGRAAQEVARPLYLDKDGKELAGDAPGEDVAETQFVVKLKPGIKFAPHPAFARNAQGEYVYHNMKREDVADKHKIADFKETGTRELTADDYVYAIRRLATPRIKSPSFSTMSDYIVGLKEYGETIVAADKALRKDLAPTDRDLPFLDFRKYPFAGAEALDKHTLRIRVKGKYPQFKYWLAMTFMAPIPWEAEKFYAQPGMAEKNLTLNFWPVGTGPFMQTEYIENRRHVLERNPNFRGEPYPCEGEPGDKEKGYLVDCGKMIPVRRQGGLRPREGGRAAAGEIHAGLLRLAGHRAARLRHRHDRGDGRRQEEGEGIPRERHQAPHDDRGEQLVHRLQLARPGRRQGRHAPRRPSATASCGRRCRSPSTGRSTSRSSSVGRVWPRRVRCRRRCSAIARTGPPPSIRSSTRRARTASRCAARSTRRSSSWPRRAIPTDATPGPASRWC